MSPAAGTRVIEADLTWTGAAFEPGVKVALDADGRIAAVGALAAPTTERLAGRALLPGFVNAHSHAFQRGLRGRGERFPAGSGSFWTWREAMYGLVESMDEKRFRALSRQAFREMLAAGITSVGEFHYLHHDASCAGWRLDRVLLEAAREAGIRLVLLQAYYNAGGCGQLLGPAQRRFATTSPAAFWAHFDTLTADLGPGQALGCVVHSVRASALWELEAVHAESKRRGLVFHMHVEEQPREVEECLDYHGLRPLELINARLDVDERFTAVHGTHSRPRDLEALFAAGGSLCVCPLTEANLGDGIPDLHAVDFGRVALGTDSNARVSMVEEMRWLEYAQRLLRGKRGIVVDGEGRAARALLRSATAAGARSLGVEAGEIRPGAWADLVALDLGAPVLEGVEAEHLPEALVFGAGEGVIAGVCVGGRWIDGLGA